MKKYGYFIGMIICLYIAVAYSQSFIQLPKVKKIYVSCQQYLELAGVIVTTTNSCVGVCSDLLKNVFTLQQESLVTINGHIDGDKDCFLQQANKIDRTNKYAKLMKIKNELERIVEDLVAMKQRLEILIADFNA